MLDDRLPSPPEWRLAWALVGIPHPLPASEYREALEAFECAFGVEALIAGLRHAAAMPTMQGWPAEARDRAATLLRRYEAAEVGA